MTIRGWIFLPRGAPVAAVRARVANEIVTGSVGFFRPDVKTAYPDAPDENTGFQIPITTPRGAFRLMLEAQINGVWQLFFTTNGHGRWWRRPFALGADSPEELLAGQLALQPQHAPRPLRSESFPLDRRSASTRLPELVVVTPNYNQARWLEQAILSVNHDDASGVRHIVRDGGSTDGSRTVLRRFDARLHAWCSEPDGGQADAIARGFAATRGAPDDLMAWLNADDHFMPGAVEFVRRYFADHPELDVLYGNRVLINEDGAEIGRWHLPPHDPAVLKLYDFVPQETLFWRRRIWDKVGGLNTSLQFAMDWDLLLRFQSADAVIRHIPRFLAAFRLHASQKSSAQIGSQGQSELDELRRRTFGRNIEPTELIHSTELRRYLKKSARLELLARWGWTPAI